MPLSFLSEFLSLALIPVPLLAFLLVILLLPGVLNGQLLLAFLPHKQVVSQGIAAALCTLCGFSERPRLISPSTCKSRTEEAHMQQPMTSGLAVSRTCKQELKKSACHALGQSFLSSMSLFRCSNGIWACNRNCPFPHIHCVWKMQACCCLRSTRRTVLSMLGASSMIGRRQTCSPLCACLVVPSASLFWNS